jgi:toxin secretion/phage lysis holin
MQALTQFKFAKEYWVFLAPILFIMIDITTGFLNAWKEQQVMSCRLRNGLVKKCGELFCIAIGEILTYALGLPHYIVYGIAGYVIFMEIVSNVENIAKMGVPIPAFINEALSHASDDFANADYVTVKKDVDAAWIEIRKLKEGDK